MLQKYFIIYKILYNNNVVHKILKTSNLTYSGVFKIFSFLYFFKLPKKKYTPYCIIILLQVFAILLEITRVYLYVVNSRYTNENKKKFF